MRELFLGINVIIDGVEQNFDYDMQPFLMDGRTFLPVRGISEALGANVDWDENTNTVYIESPSVSFLSIFTNVGVAELVGFDKIGSEPFQDLFWISMGRRWYPHMITDSRPHTRAGFQIGGSFLFDAYFIAIGNQAIYFHNDNWDTRVILTLLPNGNIRVDEYGLDWGLSGEYQFVGIG